MSAKSHVNAASSESFFYKKICSRLHHARRNSLYGCGLITKALFSVKKNTKKESVVIYATFSSVEVEAKLRPRRIDKTGESQR
jgi:hypothetical protein